MKQRGEIARGKPVKNFEKGFVVQNDLSDNSANFNGNITDIFVFVVL